MDVQRFGSSNFKKFYFLKDQSYLEELFSLLTQFRLSEGRSLAYSNGDYMLGFLISQASCCNSIEKEMLFKQLEEWNDQEVRAREISWSECCREKEGSYGVSVIERGRERSYGVGVTPVN